LPRTKEPVPAVLLITGSGPQDRDETLLGHRPFLVLADYLTRRNIAVLRVDDRGVGGSTGDILNSTDEDFAQDVLSGVEFLKGRKEISPSQIGLIGHSEGGIVAPMVAARSADVAFIVLMAGTGLTGEEIIYLQSELMARVGLESDAQIRQNRALQERIFAVLKSGKDVGAAEKALERLFEEDTASVNIEIVSKSQIEAQKGMLLSPWFRSFLIYDPRTALMNVKCPVLAINGEKDLQVPPKENLNAIEEALKAGGNEKFKILELAGLNHLFQTAETGLPIEYGRIEETISPSVLKIIGDWILSEGIGLR
jgi:pimeloyl-ACP methyl ester carboxylesterase